MQFRFIVKETIESPGARLAQILLVSMLGDVVTGYRVLLTRNKSLKITH